MEDKGDIVRNATRIASLFAVVGLLSACGTTDTAVEPPPPPPPIEAPAPAPAPTPAPQPEPSGPPMNYGDDKTLDRLWDLCAADDYPACDTLFWDSPLDSDYEQFAMDRMFELDAPEDDLTDRELVEALGAEFFLETAWNTLDRQSRNDMCNGAAVFGYEWAAQLIVDGAEGMFTVREVSDWLRGKC
jgi:hypothetical protein